ncbi:hypothetical protein DPX16_15011 [Anabarilius grahami]|uniref:Uncharacterized protein n=1 Tax=Anabarilius grahami TaxID=495550 RepID=A0A3N0YWV9_ANAGA|nr:hypothetical protein DPX16_15011 [Anabarilius grahami]
MSYSGLYASAYITSSETHSKCCCIYHLDMLEGIDQGPGGSIPMKFIGPLSVCVAIMPASSFEHLKKDVLGTGRAPSVQHRHSGALSVLSVWQSAHAIKQLSLPAKTCLCPSFNQ